MTGLSVTPCAEVEVPGATQRFEVEAWRRDWGLVAGITGRAGEANLGPWTDEPARRVMDRWLGFLEELGPEFASAVLARQVHGAALAEHAAPARGLTLLHDRDGHLTDRAGVLLAVTVADCVPIYLAHPESGAVALLHAGWRGLGAGIVGRGVTALSALAGCAAPDLIMHCGVAICGSCYEAGPEVVEALTGRRPQAAAQVDLRELAAGQARERGVGQITASTWCTAHDPERFYSHRASRGRDGRMVAYLGRPMP